MAYTYFGLDVASQIASSIPVSTILTDCRFERTGDSDTHYGFGLGNDRWSLVAGGITFVNIFRVGAIGDYLINTGNTQFDFKIGAPDSGTHGEAMFTSKGQSTSDNVLILGAGTTTGLVSSSYMTAVKGYDNRPALIVVGKRGDSINITGITKANPGVVTTSANHGFLNGETVWIQSVGGMVEVNNQYYLVANKTDTTFELNTLEGAPVNTTSYTTYTSGGTTYVVLGDAFNIFEIRDRAVRSTPTFMVTAAGNLDLTNHYFDFDQIAAPSNPASGTRRLFVNSGTGEISVRTSSGTTVSLEGGSASSVIGVAEDGSYTDGLFTDFTSSTPIGTAIDRFNEVLLGLAPPPAPALDNISTADIGVAGNLSFGSSHSIATYTNVGTAAGGSAIDVNGLFPLSGQRMGIFNASNVFNGTLNDDVAAHAYSYPADSFGPGNQGTLKLEVNGSVIHSVDLTSFGSGNSLNGNGSGFNLSAAIPVKFSDGSSFSLFQYRTGTYTVSVTDQRNGWNYCRIIHTTTGDVTTNYFEWVVDGATSITTHTSPSITGLSMTGSVFLSGVQYHTGGTATYNLTISNHHRNTYSSSASAITHPTTTNCSVPNLAINSIGAPDWEAQTQVLAQTITVDSGRILDDDVAVNTQTDRTVQSDLTSVTTNGGFELLVDTNISSPSGQTDTAESWNGEGYRQRSNLSLTSTAYSSGSGNGPANWDSTQSLTTGSAGHATGLLVYNGALRYPTQGAEGGNFSGVLNGPGGNPDYSSATGNRTYLRYFYVGSGKQNFTLNCTVSSTTFVSVATGPSGNNVTMEILAPNTTQNGVGTIEFKDAVVAYTDDNSIGCFSATYGATIPTDWGITLGSRSTATSGNVIVMRFTASSSWAGNLGNLTLTVL